MPQSAAQTSGPRLTTIHDFPSFTGDGVSPQGGLVSHKGILYGATSQGGTNNFGTVFSLTPPSSAGAGWTETILYSFTGGTDGQYPPGGLAIGADGAVFGTTGGGGAHHGGTIFVLSPPSTPGGAWTKTTLYNFAGRTDGVSPNYGLVIDQSGSQVVLYGTTSAGAGYGTVFSLTAPATPGAGWTEQVLHGFTGGVDGNTPNGGLILHKTTTTTTLYGTTAYGGSAGFGLVYSLTAPTVTGGVWVHDALYNFAGGSAGAYPLAGVLLTLRGDLYGTASDVNTPAGGLVFSLKPPNIAGGTWKEATCYTFGGNSTGYTPETGLTLGRNGTLYGTTLSGGNGGCTGTGCGAVFKLTPPTALGQPWGESLLYSFTGAGDGQTPTGPMIANRHNKLFGMTSDTAFELVP